MDIIKRICNKRNEVSTCIYIYIFLNLIFRCTEVDYESNMNFVRLLYNCYLINKNKTKRKLKSLIEFYNISTYDPCIKAKIKSYYEGS